jgi:serine/threonine protein kinase
MKKSNERVHQIGDTSFVIGRKYTDLTAIGKGSYGVVCSAIDTLTNKKVAIKKITPVVKHVEDAKHVLREIRLMRYLGVHENIITLEDLHVRESADELYIIMELFDTDLHRVISSKQPLTENHFKHFFFQLLCGVRFMHMNRIIHRDLKPANLLVSRDCKLRITDFGLARERPQGRVHHDPENSIDDPMTEHVVTRWYRACELMLLPDGLYTYAVDNWACGCILGEMLGRRPMFPGKNFVNQLTLIFEVMGCPHPSETMHIRNSQARKFLDSQTQKKKKPLNIVFPSASPESLRLLDDLLIFDPNKRITAEQALASDFLADAGGSSRRLCLTFPQVDPRLEFGFERSNASKADLKELVLQEIVSFKEGSVDGLSQGRIINSTPGDPEVVAKGAASAYATAPTEQTRTHKDVVQSAKGYDGMTSNTNDQFSRENGSGSDSASIKRDRQFRKSSQPNKFTATDESDVGQGANVAPVPRTNSWQGKAKTAWASKPESASDRNVETITRNLEAAMKKLEDPGTTEEALRALRSPCNSNANSPVREFIRSKTESGLSGRARIVSSDAQLASKVAQLFSPSRTGSGLGSGRLEAKDTPPSDREKDRDSVLMSSREHKDNITAFLESAIENDIRNRRTPFQPPAETDGTGTGGTATGIRKPTNEKDDYYFSQAGNIAQAANIINSSSNVASNPNAPKKTVTVPKGPSFSVMSWQRKQSEFEAADKEQKSEEKGKGSHLSNLLRPTASSAQKISGARSLSNPRGQKKKTFDSLI